MARTDQTPDKSIPPLIERLRTWAAISEDEPNLQRILREAADALTSSATARMTISYGALPLPVRFEDTGSSIAFYDAEGDEISPDFIVEALNESAPSHAEAPQAEAESTRIDRADVPARPAAASAPSTPSHVEAPQSEVTSAHSEASKGRAATGLVNGQRTAAAASAPSDGTITDMDAAPTPRADAMHTRASVTFDELVEIIAELERELAAAKLDLESARRRAGGDRGSRRRVGEADA